MRYAEAYERRCTSSSEAKAGKERKGGDFHRGKGDREAKRKRDMQVNKGTSEYVWSSLGLSSQFHEL